MQDFCLSIFFERKKYLIQVVIIDRKTSEISREQ
jgi:hypothetical protein